MRVVRGDYEWDPVKAAKNEKDHGVTFDEALTVLRADHLESPDDDGARLGRLASLGRSIRGRILVVVHEPHGWRTDIISARLANRRERKRYVEGG